MLTAGWRWESYGDVELAVPGDWGYGVSGRPWCLGQKSARPFVGRPGPVELVLCPVGPDRTIKQGGTFIWFSPAEPGNEPGVEGDRRTLVTGGVQVSIQAPAGLREQIASTLHRITQDSNGCPIDHPIATRPGWRPLSRPTTDWAPANLVEVCKYTIRERKASPADTFHLISSARLTGLDASAAVEGIYTTPDGSGPNAPESCPTSVAYGDEVIILRVAHGQGNTAVNRQIVLRYSGCDHHGFDQGDRVTALTRAAVAPFMTGANEVRSYSGELGDVIPLPAR